MLLAYSLNVDAPTILYFILAFVGVAALAIYLIAIIAVLSTVSRKLGTVVGGVGAIVDKLRPVPRVVGEIAGNVGAISSALGVALGEEGPAARSARPAPAAPATRRRSVRTGRGATPRRPAPAPAPPPPPPPPVAEEEEEPEEELAPARAGAVPLRISTGSEPGQWRFE